MSVFSSRRIAGSRLMLAALTAVAVGACGKDTPPEPPPPPPPPPPTRTMSVTPATVAFTDTLGTAAPSAVTVAIAQSGDTAIGAISIGTIVYGPGASDWLTFALDRTDAPATLTLQPDMTTMTAGLYTATVPVIAANASNSPQNVTVSFNLNPQPPVPPDPPPPFPPPGPIPGVVIVAAGNIGRCGSNGQPGDFNRGSMNAIARVNPEFVFALGDNAYPPSGTTAAASLADYLACYDPTWGRWKTITYATVGGRDTDSTGLAPGAEAYFGANVGPAGAYYHAFNIGTWRIISLAVRSGGNSLPVRSRYGAGSDQLAWLEQELDNTRDQYQCTLAFWHDPMWMSSSNESSTDPNLGIRRQPQRGIWKELYAAGVDVVLGGGDHIYERFAPMRYNNGEEDTTPWGPPFIADNTFGIVQFSTGLAGDGPLATPHVKYRHPLSRYRSGGNGVLKLTLGVGQYTWEFINASTNIVQDWGTGTCHGRP